MGRRGLALERRNGAGDAGPQLVLVLRQSAPPALLVDSLEAHAPVLERMRTCRRDIGSGGRCDRVIGRFACGAPPRVSILTCVPSGIGGRGTGSGICFP